MHSGRDLTHRELIARKVQTARASERVAGVPDMLGGGAAFTKLNPSPGRGGDLTKMQIQTPLQRPCISSWVVTIVLQRAQLESVSCYHCGPILMTSLSSAKERSRQMVAPRKTSGTPQRAPCHGSVYLAHARMMG